MVICYSSPSVPCHCWYRIKYHTFVDFNTPCLRKHRTARLYTDCASSAKNPTVRATVCELSGGGTNTHAARYSVICSSFPSSPLPRPTASHATQPSTINLHKATHWLMAHNGFGLAAPRSNFLRAGRPQGIIAAHIRQRYTSRSEL